MIPAAAITILAGAVFILVLFETTDPWQLLLLAMVITIALYIVSGSQKQRG